MVSIKRFKLRFMLVSMLLVFLFGGCVYDPHYYGPPEHAHHYYDPYDYYYYPGVRVYFRFSTGYYHYYSHDRWIRSRVLPSHIRIHPGDRVRIKIKSKKPYLKHHEHQKQHVPKPRHKYKVDKKRSLKEREANRRKYEDYKNNRDRHERKKGKDKKKPGRY